MKSCELVHPSYEIDLISYYNRKRKGVTEPASITMPSRTRGHSEAQIESRQNNFHFVILRRRDEFLPFRYLTKT